MKRIIGGSNWRVFMGFTEGWQQDARAACSDAKFFNMARELAHAAIEQQKINMNEFGDMDALRVQA